MDNVVSFPRPPYGAEFVRIRTELVKVMQEVSTETEMDVHAIARAENIAELTDVVRAAAAKLAEASSLCTALSRTIVNTWR